MAKCLSCSNWHSVEGLENFAETPCPSCGTNMMKPYRISDYWLYKEVGQGGMGRVYLAQQIGNPKLYAIKMAQHTSECDFRFQSLLYEGEIMLDLEHPNIPPADLFGYKQGHAFLVMSFEQGVTLEDCVKRFGDQKIPEEKLITWMLQLVEALYYMGTMGYIYRDLKPQNLIVDDDRMVLIDFGLAMHHEHKDDIDEDNLAGSPAYIPPERMLGKPEDLRSDIYSMGMVLYYAAAGKDYFHGTDIQLVAESHVEEERTPIKSLLPHLSDRFNSLIDRLIARYPEDRYQSYDELYNDLLLMRPEYEHAEV